MYMACIAATMKSCLGVTKRQKFQRRNLLEKIRIGIYKFVHMFA